MNAVQKAGAPGFAQSNWNALGTYSCSATGLKDSKGTVTTAAFTSESASINPLNMGTPSPFQPDEILHSGVQYRTWGDWTFNITGIPYPRYGLVFYQTSASAHGAQATSLTGGRTSYHSQTHTGNAAGYAAGYVDGNSAMPFTYLEVTSTNGASPTVDGNYVVFTGLAGAVQTVTIPGGFQIVDTPATTNNFVIVVPLTLTTGAFSYTRRANTIWTSTNLTAWTQDTGAVMGTVTTTNGIETVPVTLSPALLANPKLFVRVQAQ